SITVTLFGDREGRSVRAEGPRVGRRSGSGYNVEVVRVIERPGQPAQRERFLTHYRTQRRAARPPRPNPPASPAPAPGPAPAPPPGDGGTPPPPAAAAPPGGSVPPG
ncbi:MAG TPA: hypothetical protein VI854_09755, partial [Acidimicrobiia bacterium]|nr:hypothetical protein [Acidimicrobiia bacterium]